MSAIVVAGGISRRFGQEKALVKLANKPLILHVIDKIPASIDEVIVVVNSESQKAKVSKIVSTQANVFEDRSTVQTPLAGALAGFEAIHNEYTLLLACDTPFLNPRILDFLMNTCRGGSAAIPKWPNSNIEPLTAAYHVKTAAAAARFALDNSRYDMRSMLFNMTDVNYVRTSLLRRFDPKLRTFFNINKHYDLQQAESMIKAKDVCAQC